ncbi:MAG: glycosyltransferase [Acidobacteria bacterium]|jgi:glycosyltransferase involved in cell wall biosynthesis|nr:glycosyltransferase [Acidobacteriota bacterium]
MAEKVAIIHDWLNGMRGGEKVLEEMLALYPAADIFTLFYEPEAVSPLIRSRSVRASRLNRYPWVRRYYRHFLPLFPRHVEAFDLREYSLVLSSSHCVAKGAVPAPEALHVSYVHSPMRYAWDQYYAYFAGSGFWRRRVIEREISRLRAWDASSAARVDRFVANSSYVRQRIQKYYRRDAAVIHPPVDTDFFQPAGNPGREYFLLVSALAPYKNVALVLEAFRASRERLVVVGNGPEWSRLRKLAGANVQMLSEVDAERLRDLYRNARALVFAGVEDFGIAFAECQACGTPVIAFDRGGVRDIVLDRQTGLLFPEATAAALQAALAELPRLDLSSAAIRRNSLRFSRLRFREEFQRLVGEGRA